MPDEVKERALKEVDRMSRIPTASPEVGVIRTYVDWLASLPWDHSTEDNLDIRKAAVVLDEDHYGLEKVKERILEYLSVRSLADTIRSPILALVGPPGVGKTSLGKSVARAMGREFVRMSLGGIHDEAEIRGHRRTYIGALPGRVIQNIKTAGSNNPVFMLDEIDKIGMDFRGDPSSALLEVLDPEQNGTFADNYLEVPFDLSKVLFIATGNLVDPIPTALRDRMEIIQLPGYTQREKAEIGRRFLVPKQMENHGLKPKNITITDEAMTSLVQNYTHEAGVRNLEREIASVMRKVARSVAEGRKSKTTVNERKLKQLLGPERFEYGELEEEDQIGAATGLVVTAVGGDVVSVEVTRMEGKEDFILTGQLGDVMRESARAGLSWTRANATRLGISREMFEKHTMHIHVPAGAIPKDGPSAGITMATAIVSSLTGIPVNKDVAMTGEITLRGRVLPIGGLKFKILAAHLSGAKIVIIPKKNEKDLRDVPEEIRKNLKIIAVENMDQVLAAALRRKPRALKPEPDHGGQQERCQGGRDDSAPGAGVPAGRAPTGTSAGVIGQGWSIAITTPRSASTRRQVRPTSRRPFERLPVSTIPTSTRTTPRPNGASRRSARPTRSSPIPRSARPTISSVPTGRATGTAAQTRAPAIRSPAWRSTVALRCRAGRRALRVPRLAGRPAGFSDFFRAFFSSATGGTRPSTADRAGWRSPVRWYRWRQRGGLCRRQASARRSHGARGGRPYRDRRTRRPRPPVSLEEVLRGSERHL